MGRLRRRSRAIENAEIRLQNVKAISPTLDLGGGLSVASYAADIERGRGKIEEYNQALAFADQKYNEMLAAEKNVADSSQRMLAGIAARYGTDSNEYEMAGGTRKSERKRVARAPKENPAPTA